MRHSTLFIAATIGLLLAGGMACRHRAARFVEYANPVVAGDFPDPSVIRMGGYFWATATSGEWSPAFPLLRSPDLVDWEQIGAVFTNRPAWAMGNFWAPEIAEHEGTFFVYYTARQQGGSLAVAVATARHPSGPYTDHGPMVAQPAGSIDAAPVTDTDGQRYLVWKEDGNSRREPTVLWAQLLDRSGTRLIGEPHELMRNDAPWEGAVVEGPFFLRRGPWLYLFYSGNACCGPGCNYALGVARARTLRGPWEKFPGNPILKGNAIWRCPGHGSVVQDRDNRYWLLYHAYSADGRGTLGRQGLLDEVVFGADGWPSIRNGEGPSGRAPAPRSVAQSQRAPFYDAFDGKTLKPEWRWPAGQQAGVSLTNGWLHLSGAGASQPQRSMPALVALLPKSDRFTAETSIDTARFAMETEAGISAWADRGHASGIAVRRGGVRVWKRVGDREETLVERLVSPAGGTIRLRMRASGSEPLQWSYQHESQWIVLDLPAVTAPRLPEDRTVRVALTAAGSAYFDSFLLEDHSARPSNE